MGKAESQTEYDKLTGLLAGLGEIRERGSKVLDGVEAALEGNTGNAEALSNLERNLRSVRARVLSELAGITKQFG